MYQNYKRVCGNPLNHFRWNLSKENDYTQFDFIGYRVLRGGSWYSGNRDFLHVANRYNDRPYVHINDVVGFRISHGGSGNFNSDNCLSADRYLNYSINQFYNNSLRIMRGGSWFYDDCDYLRVADRVYDNPNFRGYNIVGFRVLREYGNYGFKLNNFQQ